MALEILVDLDDEKRAAAVDPGGDVLVPARFGLAMKDAGSVQAGEKGAEAAAVVLVEHGVGHGVEVEAGGVAEEQALQDRRQEDDEAAAGILQDGEKFLPDQRQDAKERGEHGVASGKLLAGGQPGGDQQPRGHAGQHPMFGQTTLRRRRRDTGFA
jgi:hypothetical protein